MQALVEQLKAQNAAGAGMAIGPSDNGGGGMDAESARMIAELQEKLAAKQTDLSREMEGEGGGDERADQQRKVVNLCPFRSNLHISSSIQQRQRFLYA